MPIHFYSSDGCPHCVAAKKTLAGEIASGKIVVMKASEAPKEAPGFPYFVNKANGMAHAGAPPSADFLFEKLYIAEVKEGFTSDYDWSVGVL